MDESVLAAMQRWPNVPAVYGWLSLTARGEWRLHPDGQAKPGDAGESITNPQILAFIGRNYAAESNGSWYFQNGPQRVYVTLSLAPWIFRLADDACNLVSHTDRPVQRIDHWWLADSGVLYLETDLGPGTILDRDLMAVLTRLQRQDGTALESQLETAATSQDPVPDFPPNESWHLQGADYPPAPLQRLASADAAQKLGFRPDPRP